MEDLEIYKNDALGLKYLNERGRIKRVFVKGDHV